MNDNKEIKTVELKSEIIEAANITVESVEETIITEEAVEKTAPAEDYILQVKNHFLVELVKPFCMKHYWY